MADKKTPKLVTVKCTVANIWTTKGKVFLGESVDLSADEAKAIKKAMSAMEGN